MPKLTKRLVEAAAPKERHYYIFDEELPGFGVRILISGRKSFLVQHRIGGRGGETRRLALGMFGAVTVEEARKRAIAILGQRAAGNDPIKEIREGTKRTMSVAEFADLYLAEGPGEKPNKKVASWSADRSNIERHIKPLLGRKMVEALTQADIARFQTDVAGGKSKADIKTKKRGRAIVEGGRGTAARSLAVLGAMLEFGVGRKLISANPAKGVRLFKSEKKERFLSASEVAILADTLARMEAERALSATAAVAVRLLVLTGCRKSEILTLQWDWVDFERGCIRLPDSKTGAKVVPLAAAAMELLNGVPRNSAFVLPAGKADGHYSGLQKDWERIRERAKLHGVRLHDLRHSFASFAVADGHTLFMVGKVLGHKHARTTEGYAHLAADPIRAVADRTAARISAAMRSGLAAEVVPVRRIPQRRTLGS
jgi:integrase